MKEKDQLNKNSESIISSEINVPKQLVPGLLESTYEACLFYELTKSSLKIEQQKPLPIVYDEVKLDCAYRLDILV